VVLQLALVAVGVTVAWAAAPTATTIEDCFADNGFTNVVVHADGSIEIPRFTAADNNAGQAWDAHIDRIYDTCTGDNNGQVENLHRP